MNPGARFGLEALKILTSDEAISAVHALNDDTRRRILNALKAKKMSTTELVEFLSKDDPENSIKPQTVRYHLKKLQESNLVKLDGYAHAGNGNSHILKKVWRAVAEHIFIAATTIEDFPEREAYEVAKARNIIRPLEEIGFKIPENEDAVAEIAELFVEWDTLWRKCRDEAAKDLKNIGTLDPNVYVSLRRILSILHLTDSEYERYWEVSRHVTDRLRKAYRNGKGKNPEVY